MSSGQSHDPLQAYIDELLLDNLFGEVAAGSIDHSASRAHIDETALKRAAGDNVAPLLSAARPVRSPAARPYAEAIRTLNLRMPLPPVAPATEVAAPVETRSEAVVAPAVELPAAVVEPAVTSALQAEVIAETKQLIETSPPAALVDVALAPSAAAALDNDLTSMPPPAAWLSNGRPQWAQQPFECLIVQAGGLQLAAPLVELGSIYPLDAEALTPIFGQTDWFMGLLPVKEYNVRVMDTALVVMPERYDAQMCDRYRYVVSLYGSDWGLAVDAVVGTTLLDPDRIRWRGERSKRPWLAGTLIDLMCALFDIAQLAWLFHNQDRKRGALAANRP